MPSSVLALAWRRYMQQLDAKPLKTKAVTAAVLAGASDLLAQRLTSSGGTNWRRTLCIALYGFLWAGPSSHYWQQALEKLFPDKRDPLRSLKKMLTDQLTYGPLQNALFMAFLAAIVEGRSWGATAAKLRGDFVGVQRSSWRVWPVASYVNQQFVPLQLRVLWLNVVALGWSTFMIVQGRKASSLRPKLAPR